MTGGRDTRHDDQSPVSHQSHPFQLPPVLYANGHMPLMLDVGTETRGEIIPSVVDMLCETHVGVSGKTENTVIP
jgi:hypothetical protein